MKNSQTGARYFVAAGALGSLLLMQGCIATRDWVKEQMDPVSSRVATNEQKLTQVESQVTSLSKSTTEKFGQVEGRLGQFEGRLGSGRCENRQGSKYAGQLEVGAPFCHRYERRSQLCF